MKRIFLMVPMIVASGLVACAGSAPVQPAAESCKDGTGGMCSAAVSATPAVAPSANPAEKPPASPAATRLDRIVFVDQAECCHCTQARIDASWAALGSALGDPAAFPVERLHSDTQAEQVAAYSTFKPIMVIPAVYFVGADNSVMEMLQGELRPVQITEVLGRLAPR